MILNTRRSCARVNLAVDTENDRLLDGMHQLRAGCGTRATLGAVPFSACWRLQLRKCRDDREGTAPRGNVPGSVAIADRSGATTSAPAEGRDRRVAPARRLWRGPGLKPDPGSGQSCIPCWGGFAEIQRRKRSACAALSGGGMATATHIGASTEHANY